MKGKARVAGKMKEGRVDPAARRGVQGPTEPLVRAAMGRRSTRTLIVYSRSPLRSFRKSCRLLLRSAVAKSPGISLYPFDRHVSCTQRHPELTTDER